MYCTADDIQSIVPEQELIELTDDVSPPAIINDTVLARAIADAGELVDGYLRGRYGLPLSPVPGLINTLAVDVAIYRLYTRRVLLVPPKNVEDRYKNALKILEQIQAGKIALGAESSGGEAIPARGGPQAIVPERVFSRETLGDY